MFTGYFAKTNQRALKILFRQHRSFEEQLHILQFIPFIKPITDDDDDESFKSIQVFEHTLSRYGIYNIEVASDMCWRLCMTTHSQKRLIKEFSSAHECLRYVYDNHPYEGTKDRPLFDEDYDD